MNGFDANFDSDLQNILRPQNVTASGTGADTPQTVDMVGKARAVIFIGALSAGTTFTAKLEHSEDGSSWSDLPGGAFPPIATAVSGASIPVDIRAAKKFVRTAYTATGGTVNLEVCGFMVGNKKRIN
jgi:hypothetical protein